MPPPAQAAGQAGEGKQKAAKVNGCKAIDNPQLYADLILAA